MHQYVRVVIAFQQVIEVVMLVDGFQGVENLIIIIIILIIIILIIIIITTITITLLSRMIDN